MGTFEILLLLGSIQGFLLSTLLFTHKENQPANMFLGIGCFSLSLELAFIILRINNVELDYPHIVGITFPLAFVYGPVFYIYVKILTSPEKKFNKNDFMHFIPFFIVLIYYFPNYFLSAQSKLVLEQSILNNNSFYLNIINDIKPIHGTVYMIFMVLYVNKYLKTIKNSFSNIDKINLSWLRYLAGAMFIISAILIIEHVFEFVYNDKSIFENLLFLSLAILVYSFGYLGLKQPEIFSQISDKNSILLEENNNIEKYKKSGLNEALANEYLEKLNNLMKVEKPYLDCNLTLQQLAEKLNITQHNLSEIINSKLDQNYYDFINKYRVEEFIERITADSQKKYKIITIAFDSGFNSKSTFNTIFKKFTGKTPSEYRN